MSYTLVYDPWTGEVIGATQGSGMIPSDPTNRDWQAFLAWNAQQVPPLSLSPVVPFARRPRTLHAIYADLQSLTNAQKTNVWTDLSSGSPKKYLTSGGINAGAIGALDWSATDSGATGSSLTAARLRIVAAYCQDNPGYLVNPSFDPTINVPGDQLV